MNERGYHGDPQDRISTAMGVGLGVPATIIGHKNVLSARKKAGADSHAFQFTDIARLKGASRLRHAGIYAGSRVVGGAAMGLTASGVHGMATRRSPDKVRGYSPSQLAERVKVLATPGKKREEARASRKRVWAGTTAGGLIGGAAASELTNAVAGKVGHKALPHWGRGLASTAGAAIGIAGGIHAAEMGSGGRRVQKAADTPVDTRIKRNHALVQAHTLAPFIGDYLGPAQAYKLAPQEHKKKAWAATQAGTLAGNIGGTIAGSMLLHGAASRSARIARGASKVSTSREAAERAVRRTVRLPEKKPQDGKTGRVGSFVRRTKLNTPEGIVGGFVLGGLASPWTGGAAHSAYQRRYERPSYQRDMLKHPSVAKSEPALGLTNAENAQLRRRKRKQVTLSNAGALAGGTATALLGASKLRSANANRLARRVGTYVKPTYTPGQKLAANAANLSIAGGGIGAVSSLNFARTQSLESRQRIKKNSGAAYRDRGHDARSAGFDYLSDEKFLLSGGAYPYRGVQGGPISGRVGEYDDDSVDKAFGVKINRPRSFNRGFVASRRNYRTGVTNYYTVRGGMR